MKKLRIAPQTVEIKLANKEMTGQVTPFVVLPMIKDLPEGTPLPSRYRVIGWCVDGKCWVWAVVVIKIPGQMDHKSVSDLREAAAIEIDDYFPFLLKRLTDDVYQRYMELKSILDWSVPQLMEWNIVRGKLTAEVTPNGVSAK